MGTAIRTGRGSRIAYGIETAWGTEAARTITGNVISVSLQTQVETVDLPHLMGTTATGRVRAESYIASEKVSGDTNMVAMYEGGCLGVLLRAALGTSVDAGAGPYTHTVTVSDAAPPAFSAELVRGMENGAADITEEFYGLMCTDWEFNVPAGKHAEWKATWVGKSSGTRAAIGTVPAIDAGFPILHRHVGQLGFGGNNFTLSSLKIKGSNKLVSDLQELGSLYITEPPVGDFAEIMCEADVVLRSQQLYTDFRAGTQGDLTVSITDGTRTLAWTLHNVKITAYGDPIGDAGVITAKVTWKCYSGASESGVSVVLTNSKTTTLLS